METMELFYPQMEVRVGTYTFRRGMEIEACSSRAPFDWAKVRFTEQFQPKIGIGRKEPAVLRLGYNGSLEDLFTGYVAKDYNSGASLNEITLKDAMLLVEETTINHTFLDATPQEILAYVLMQAGVTKMKLDSTAYPTRRQLPIRKQTGVQAIRTINAAWGLQAPFFFSGDTFYWNQTPGQDKLYVFEYGINILTLDRVGGLWVLETALAPFVHHSNKIRIIHPRVSGDMAVVKVVTATNDSGFLRTTIYF